MHIRPTLHALLVVVALAGAACGDDGNEVSSGDVQEGPVLQVGDLEISTRAEESADGSLRVCFAPSGRDEACIHSPGSDSGPTPNAQITVDDGKPLFLAVVPQEWDFDAAEVRQRDRDDLPLEFSASVIAGTVTNDVSVICARLLQGGKTRTLEVQRPVKHAEDDATRTTVTARPNC